MARAWVCWSYGRDWTLDTPAGRAKPLLPRRLFTAKLLSAQAHQLDTGAAEGGHPRGWDEAWCTHAAEPGARVAHGLQAATSPAQLRRLASIGAIERHLRMLPVRAGDFIHVPAVTVHAVGAGLVLAEVQQRADPSYRLYDYGRPRALQLQEGIDVSMTGPAPAQPAPLPLGPGRQCLVLGTAFTVELREEACTEPVLPGPTGSTWVMAVSGAVELGGVNLHAGECALMDETAALNWRKPGSSVLVACGNRTATLRQAASSPLS